MAREMLDNSIKSTTTAEEVNTNKKLRGIVVFERYASYTAKVFFLPTLLITHRVYFFLTNKMWNEEKKVPIIIRYNVIDAH